MLKSETRKGLKSLTTLGNAAIIRYPYTTVLQKNKSIIAFVNMEEYGEDEFDEFGLDETLPEFLSLIEFYKDPDIENEGTLITIKSGNSVQHYQTSDVETMKSFDVSTKALEKIEVTPEVLSFNINKEDFQRFKKIASITKANSFLVRDGEIVVGKVDRNGNVENDSVTQYPVSSTKNVTAIFDVMNISKLPDKDYQVSIRQSEKTGNGISLWTVEDEPIQIVVSVQEIKE